MHRPACFDPPHAGPKTRMPRMPRASGLAVATVFALTFAFDATASEALARDKGCLACHKVDAKVVGPAYKEVAAKYAGQADAEKKLVQKVINGGGGNWGFVPMPPNASVSEEEAVALVKWILANP